MYKYFNEKLYYSVITDQKNIIIKFRLANNKCLVILLVSFSLPIRFCVYENLIKQTSLGMVIYNGSTIER